MPSKIISTGGNGAGAFSVQRKTGPHKVSFRRNLLYDAKNCAILMRYKTIYEVKNAE